MNSATLQREIEIQDASVEEDIFSTLTIEQLALVAGGEVITNNL